MTDEGKRSTVQVLCERLAGPDVDTIQCVLAALRVMLEAHEPTEGCPTPHAQIEEFGLAQLEEQLHLSSQLSGGAEEKEQLDALVGTPYADSTDRKSVV